MKTISAALAAHIAGETATLATCWKITRQDSTVLGFTDHDSDITFGGITYAAASGYTSSDIATSSALDVDNLQLQGVLSNPNITEVDLSTGLWDFAEFEIFQVNYEDLTQGNLKLKSGRLGEVTLQRDNFVAELRGLTLAYQQTIGRLDTPSCTAELGDARCTVNMTGFTVSGTLTGVHADGVTLYDTARTEPGPTGGVSLLSVNVDDPGVLVFNSADIADWPPYLTATVAGITAGPTWLNTVVVLRRQSVNGYYVTDPITTAEASAFAGTATVTPSGDSGYFDDGVITMTSGANSGFSMEVKSYVPGQFVLHLPFPYACQVGDTYSMKAGCNKSLTVCKNRFSNVINFRGFPYLPGLDKVVQPGRHGE